MSSATSSTRFRSLRIDTSHAASEFSNTGVSTDTLVVPPTPTPSFLISSPTKPNPNPPTPASPSFQKAAPDPYSRAKFESRKLLAHVLDQLQSRLMPPKASSTITRDSETAPDTRLGTLMATVTGVVKFKQTRKEIGQPLSPTLDEESEDEDEDAGYSTETTYNLMLQLKDVLAISKAQGLDIFDVGNSSDGHDEGNPTGFRRSKGGLGAPGRRSRSPSPAFSAHIRAPKLLAVCISILASVVLEDCRYKITSPRPSRPPNALQLLTLQIAQYLIYSQRHNPKIVAEIGFAMLPAFVTFHADMHFRLLEFFEGAMLRRAIEGIEQLQGIENGKHVQNSLTQQEVMGISIQVDEVPDEGTGAPKWQSWPTNTGQKILSVNAPKQPEVIYHFASLVPALLSSVLENVDPFAARQNKREFNQRLQSLFDMVVRSKLDAYTDFLQVIAYHTPKARRAATSLMLRYWPRVVGHVAVSCPHNHLSSPSSSRLKNEENERLYAHQFVPWHFASRTSPKASHAFATRPYDCRVCLQGIHDFGLLCPWCMSAVHFDCYDYPAGNQTIEYSMATNKHIKRVAMYRFSPTLGTMMKNSVSLTRKSKHILRTITTFTLCLCFACRTPLWGCSNQGLQCISCSQFFHSHCINGSPIDQSLRCDHSEITSEHMVIEWSSLRSSCVSHYSDIFALAEQELGSLSFEELSILHGVLWTQLQLLTSGIAMGSIIVMHRGKSAAHTKDNKVYDFELHHVIQWCEAYLLANNQPCSPAMEEYLSEYTVSKRSSFLMFDWSTLAYIASSMRSREHATSSWNSTTATSNLLNVTRADLLVDDSKESLEIAPLSYLRNSLGYEFGIHSDIAAKHLLSHLHHLGFFTRLDGGVDLFRTDEENNVQCVLGLPLGFDMSTDVETLASAIEASLSDLDLAVNEVGLLLLTRRFWPNAMMSDYALRRLSRGLVYWILAEDNNLATIFKDYIAKQKALPGVCPANGPSSWPAAQSARPTPVSSVNNGGDYVAARRMLLLRYAAPWLLQLHDQDPRDYTSILQNICLENAQDKVGNLDKAERDRTPHTLALCEALLHAITRLSQTSVTFSIFNDLFVGWMDLVSSYSLLDEPIPSLSRLFPRDADGHQRTSTLPEPSTAQPDSLNFAIIDPWRVVMAAANKSKSDLSRSLRWLRIFANCGINIPDPTLLRFANLVVHFDSGLEDALMLTTSALSSLWLKSLGRQRLQRLFSILHSYLAEHILKGVQGVKQDSIMIFTFVRQSLGSCLLLYGHDRESIIQSGLVQQTEIEKLPSKRKFSVRAMPNHDPILIDSELLGVLGRYMAADVNDMSCILATFLDLLLAGSSLFESYEMDNFILKNGVFLSTCAWSLYGLQDHQISSVRTKILLRTLVVDPQPFQEIITACFQATEQWERRLLAVTQLFRIILDVISPAFSIEDRQWRSSVVDVFFHFFGSMWADEQEEVRLTAQTLSQTLLPAHFETIAACWTESLLKAPFDERVKLVSFLTQLHPHFPSWKVLYWDAILEIYNSEGVQFMAPRHGQTGGYVDKSHGAVNDKEMINLRVSVMILALQLVADGIPIDQVTLAHLKFNFCHILGFHDVTAVPTRDGQGIIVHFGEIKWIEEHAISCIDELVQVLDSTHHIERHTTNASSAGGQTDKSLSVTLVGTAFVDMTLALFYSLQGLSNLPVLTIKNLLEAVCIIIYKHDFEDGALRPQQKSLKKAVVRSLELMLQEVSFEVRQLALSVVQAFIKRWSKIMGSTIYTALESTAKLIASQSHHGQDALVLQGKRFIEATLSTYSEHGLLANLLKRPLDRDFFVILKQILESVGPSLRTPLFRDTFLRLAAIDADQSVLQLILNNLQSLIEIVHHVNYDHDLVLAVGQCLIFIAKRAQSDGNVLEFDATGLLLVPALLIQHNKLHSRDILAYTETLLRVALTRLNVPPSCLIELLTVTGDLYRKFATESTPTNPVALIVFDILGDSLRSKTKVLLVTLKALVEAVTSEKIARILEINPSLNLTDHGIQFLYSHVWLSSEDFAASMAVARMILRGARHDPTVVGRFASYTLDKPSRQIQVVRAWNILLLAAMQDTEDKWSDLLLSHLATFAAGHQGVLRWYSQPEVALPETALTDINHAYISLKLWVVVAKSADNDAAPRGVWQDLWPPFEALVDSLDKQPNLPPTFIALVSSSVADLFLFLATLHTPLSLQTSLHAALLNKLKQRGRGDTTSSKVTRALRALTDPPLIVPLEGLVDQIGMEIMAAEKLRMLETRRDVNAKIGLERR